MLNPIFENNRKNKLNIIVFTIMIIFGSVFLIYTMPLKPQKNYSKNLSSVVELKASTEGIGNSYGTAVFINKEGELITNAHVVTYQHGGIIHVFDKYEVRFADKNNYIEVEVIKYDVQIDIALLKIKEACDFKPVQMGDSAKLKAGDTVYAVGNALNHGISITRGIVSVPFLDII